MWVKVLEPVVFWMYKFRHLSLILHWLALFLAFMTSLAIVSDVISDAERKTLKTYLWHLQDTVSVRIKSLEKSNRHRALWCFWNSTFVRHRSHRTWSFEAREFSVLAQVQIYWMTLLLAFITSLEIVSDVISGLKFKLTSAFDGLSGFAIHCLDEVCISWLV